MNDEHIQTEEPGSRAEVPRRFRILVFTMSLAMAAAGIGMLVARSTQPIRTATLYCSAPPVKAGQTASGETLAQIAAAMSPSVVSITAKGTTTLKGSGIVIRSDGMVLTNNHIVADVGVNGGEIIVDFADGHTAPAIIVGRSPEDAVAVIQVQHSEVCARRRSVHRPVCALASKSWRSATRSDTRGPLPQASCRPSVANCA